MTTSTAGSRWPREGWPNHAAMWLGHYQELILMGAITAGIADDLSGRPSALTWVADILFTAWFATLLTDVMAHQRQLCERCISEAPTLNPEGAVSRWRPALWCFHRKRMNNLAMLAVICWLLGSSQIRHEHEWALGLDALSLVVLGYTYFIGRVHRLLYPWCPWCRWDDGGGEEVAPPVPEDHGVLT